MVNWDFVTLVIFFVILLALYFRYKDKFVTQGIIVMYKTKWGLNLMDRLAKPYPRLLTFVSTIGVFVGFLGMGYLLYFLVTATWQLIFIAGTEPVLAPVLPGVQIPGAPHLSFWHWILAIFIAAGIHEFSHGLIARLHKVPIHSSGFAFFGPLPAAFVEPDEKILSKKTALQQMAIFAAGPFSNILLGVFLFLVLFFLIAPLSNTLYEENGIIVTQTLEGYPVNLSGLDAPFTIYTINEIDTLGVFAFENVTKDLEPGDTVTLGTDKGDYTLTLVGNPENGSKAFFGVSGFQQDISLKEEYSYLRSFTGIFDWTKLLLVWLFLISVGVGLFNLLPLGPVDGGRMFYTLMLVITKKENLAKNILLVSSLFCLALILINMLPWLEKLFSWIWSGFVLLIGLF
ncbi:hypothetical protein EXS74_01565 [Candidatus Woesearchaeota archaeon]|nr:hypothetical protein [Candidatus Woesearchaeota archaeon]